MEFAGGNHDRYAAARNSPGAYITATVTQPCVPGRFDARLGWDLVLPDDSAPPPARRNLPHRPSIGLSTRLLNRDQTPRISPAPQALAFILHPHPSSFLPLLSAATATNWSASRGRLLPRHRPLRDTMISAASRSVPEIERVLNVLPGVQEPPPSPCRPRGGPSRLIVLRPRLGSTLAVDELTPPCRRRFSATSTRVQGRSVSDRTALPRTASNKVIAEGAAPRFIADG